MPSLQEEILNKNKKKDFESNENELTKDEIEYIKNFKRFFSEKYEELILNFSRLEPVQYHEVIDSIKRYLNEVVDKRKKKTRSDKITSSQLRNIFSKLKPETSIQKVMLLRPQLAYIGGRTDSKELKELVFILETLIKRIDDSAKLQSFKEFFEAIIAYHKYYGGK